MTVPTVSVGMPVFNAERYVAEAVQSVLQQTLMDFELIVIDDGSTDGSGTILEDFAARDARIRLSRRENRGIVATRNEILNKCSGRYYAMMDADDISLPQRLEEQSDYLEWHSECVGVSARVLLIDPDGDPIRTINEQATHEEFDGANLRGDGFLVNNAYMVRRDVMVELGGFRDFCLAEDLDLFLRLGERGQIAIVPEVLYKYRQHLTNTCHTRREELNRCVRKAIEDACARRGLSTDWAAMRALPGGLSSRIDQQRTWAWWALAAGNVQTARKHALAALRRAPFAVESWRLACCALRGY